MGEVWPVLVKALAGGGLVLAFSCSARCFSQALAGLFSAAPAVAVAGLAVTVVAKGSHDAREASIGMLAGSVGMLGYALVTIRLLRRGHSLFGSALEFLGWALPAAAVAVLL